MKIKRIATLPFAMAADALTMCNIGDRSFTQQVFDAERREQRQKHERELAKALLKAISRR